MCVMIIRGIKISVVESAKGKKIFDGGTNLDENSLRLWTRGILLAGQKQRKRRILVPAPHSKDFPVAWSSRIMAQEAWRYSRETKNPAIKEIIFTLNNEKDVSFFKKILTGYLGHLVNVLCQGPFVTVDGIIEYNNGVVLIERSNPPFGWAMPGGFLDYGESAEEGVRREVKEETGLDFTGYKLFKVCSRPERDPRFHTVTIVFYGKGKGILKAASDAKGAGIFTPDNLPPEMAFDHKSVIEEYFKRLFICDSERDTG